METCVDLKGTFEIAKAKTKEILGCSTVWCFEWRNAGAQLLSANIRGFEPAGPGPSATSAAILVMYNSAVRTREGCSSSRVSFGLMT